jgi:hypothetical protein
VSLSFSPIDRWMEVVDHELSIEGLIERIGATASRAVRDMGRWYELRDHGVCAGPTWNHWMN